MKVLLRLGTLPLLLLTASCGSDAPVDPSAAAHYAYASRLDQLARYQSGLVQVTTGVVSKVIGPEGGTLSLGAFEVVVPPGAVEIATPFSIRLPVAPLAGEYVRAIFLPHRDFLVPVTIRLPLKGTTSEASTDVNVLWWNEAEWVPFETRVTEDGRVETQTSHFSEFGLEDFGFKGVILGTRPCGSACAN